MTKSITNPLEGQIVNDRITTMDIQGMKTI